MNTRGLTELIVLNLALDAGAISNTLFAMLVIMAVVTTLMAGPLLKLLDPKNEYGRGVEDEFADAALAAVQAHPELPVPERSILVAPQTDAAIAQLVALAEPLARSVPPRELIIARLVRPPRGAGRRRARRPAVREPGARTGLACRSTTRASGSPSDGVVARGVALTSTQPGLRPRAHRRARADRPRAHRGTPAPDRRGRATGRRRRADGARRVRRGGAGGQGGRPDRARSATRPCVVPFGGAEHDWAALELGSWLAASSGAPLKLLGAAGQTDEGKSVTRMLADAGLLVQQATGIATEPLVVAGGRDGIVEAATGAGLLVLGLSDRWRHEGLGHDAIGDRQRRLRRRCCSSSAAPGPGCSRPKENVTQFRWSMVGGPGTLGRLAGGLSSATPTTEGPSPDEPPISVS